MKLWRSPYLKAACGALALLAVGSFGAYQHARYYTGDVPGTVSCLSCHVEAQGLNPLDLIRQARYVSPNKLKVAPDGSQLIITGRDSDSLLVVEDRTVDRAGDVVFSKLGRRANVDDFIKGRKLADPLDGGDVMFHAQAVSC